MAAIKNRIAKLEASNKPLSDDVQIIRVIVDCGGKKPIGYRCDNTEMFQRNDESEDEFISRYHNAIQWPSGRNFRHIFEPIYGD